ncbi:hypothetical protein [Alteraurantiacibacter aquimixticola]|nr:hypothetical protein [Alteraurantiacibacter aquimixticola]
MSDFHSPFVIPAQAGIQLPTLVAPLWIPACAGMTGEVSHV